MRFEMDGPNLSVMQDSPFLKHYKVDYVNMSRNVTGTVSTNTQIATGTQSAIEHGITLRVRLQPPRIRNRQRYTTGHW